MRLPGMPTLWRITLLVVSTYVIGLAVAVGACKADEGHASSDTGWRRTAAGWEYVESWTGARVAAGGHRYPLPPPADIGTKIWRIDSHPAALALLQLTA